ncbi:MAG: DUF72 domain-containing protein [Methanomassiliicoccales archaeon]
MTSKEYRFGCSGWSYKDWIGKFYRKDCEPSKMLEEYAKIFNTVEINMSFYRLPFEGLIKSWRMRVPEGFLFCPKMSRKITHIKRLNDVGAELVLFLTRMRILGEKLGPILIQLPPGIKKDLVQLENFLSMLPRDLKFTIEFRNKNWTTSEVLSLLATYGVAICFVDSPKMIFMTEPTADFAYIRWHGRKSWYRYEYKSEEIREWVKFIQSLNVDCVYGFWNNDFNANAPRNCLELISMLGNKSK